MWDMGRPTKCTPETIKRVSDGIRLGMVYEHAAKYGGIGYSTLREWMIKGEQGIEPFSEFADAVKSAEGECVAANMATIRDAALSGKWQAAAWIMERRYTSAYGRTVQEVRLDDRRKLQDMSDDELDAEILHVAQAIIDQAKGRPTE